MEGNLELMESMRSSAMTSSSLTQSSRARALKKDTVAPALEPLDALKQLHEWRQKALLNAQAWVRLSLVGPSKPLPGFLPQPDFLQRARNIYSKCWELAKAFSIGGEEWRALCVDIGNCQRLQGDGVAALCMGVEAGDQALIEWGLHEVENGSRLHDEQRVTELALALEKLGQEALELLESYKDFSEQVCGSHARHLARCAAKETSMERRAVLLAKLGALGPRLGGSVVTELLSSCGDLDLKIQMEEGGPAIWVLKVSRIALADSSPYFDKLLRGLFAESNKNEISVVCQFPRAMERAVSWLYSGYIDFSLIEDAIELLQIATQFQMDQLRADTCEFLVSQIKDVELDGDALAFILMLNVPPHFEARLVQMFARGLAALNSPSTSASDVEQYLGSADWDMVFSHGDVKTSLRQCLVGYLPEWNNEEMLTVVVKRLGAIMSNDHLISLLWHVNPDGACADAVADLLEPQSWRDATLSNRIRCRLLRGVKDDIVPTLNLSEWYIGCSDKAELQNLLEVSPKEVLRNSFLSLCLALVQHLPERFEEIYLLGPAQALSAYEVDELLFAAVEKDCLAAVKVMLKPELVDHSVVRGKVTLVSMRNPEDQVKDEDTNADINNLFPSFRPPQMDDLDQLMNDLGAPAGICPECHIVEGHLTTCSRFKGANRVRIGRFRSVPPKRVPTLHEQMRMLLDHSNFAFFSGTRSLLSHACLSSCKPAMVEFLIQSGCKSLPNESPFSALECAVWRGMPEPIVRSLLEKDGYDRKDKLLVPNTAIGWTPLHIAIAMSHADLVPLLWSYSPPEPYNAKVFTGAQVEFRADYVVQEHSVTDATKEAFLKLIDRPLKPRVALPPPPPPGGNNNNNNNNNNVFNNNNNNNNIHDIEVEPVWFVFVSGPLLRLVKASLFRKFTQVRFCSLLRGPNHTTVWRENMPNMVVREFQILSVKFEKGNRMIISTSDNVVATYQLEDENTMIWRNAIAESGAPVI